MKIAVLGWGSLIWRLGTLQVAGDWQADGPVLPIELSRISNDGRLTLVVDEQNGAEVPTRYAISAFDDLALAIADLQKREGATSPEAIGFTDLAKNNESATAKSRHGKSCERIKAWAAARQIDAVIWTALESNFASKASKAFSVDAAIQYLGALTGKSRDLAREYIEKAPAEVRTPVRQKAEELFA